MSYLLVFVLCGIFIPSINYRLIFLILDSVRIKKKNQEKSSEVQTEIIFFEYSDVLDVQWGAVDTHRDTLCLKGTS